MYYTFCMDLRRWRTRNSVSVTDIARACAISESAIRHYETGIRRPRLALAKRIASFTDDEVTVAELLGLDKRESTESARDRETAVIRIQVPGSVADEAERLGLDTAELVAEGGLEGLRRAVRQSWAEENAQALEANREHIERHGTFGERAGRSLGR